MAKREDESFERKKCDVGNKRQRTREVHLIARHVEDVLEMDNVFAEKIKPEIFRVSTARLTCKRFSIQFDPPEFTQVFGR